MNIRSITETETPHSQGPEVSMNPKKALVKLMARLRSDFALDGSPEVRLDEVDPDYVLLKRCVDAVRASYKSMGLLKVTMSGDSLSAMIFALNGALVGCLFQMADLETYTRLRAHLSILPR